MKWEKRVSFPEHPEKQISHTMSYHKTTGDLWKQKSSTLTEGQKELGTINYGCSRHSWVSWSVSHWSVQIHWELIRTFHHSSNLQSGLVETPHILVALLYYESSDIFSLLHIKHIQHFKELMFPKKMWSNFGRLVWQRQGDLTKISLKSIFNLEISALFSQIGKFLFTPISFPN